MASSGGSVPPRSLLSLGTRRSLLGPRPLGHGGGPPDYGKAVLLSVLGLVLLGGLLHRFRPEHRGELVWVAAAGDAVRVASAAADGRVFAAGEDRTLYAWAADQGRLLWRLPVAAPVSADLRCGEGQLYAGFESGQVAALRAADGHLSWQVPVPGAPAFGFARCGDSLVVATDTGDLRALLVSSGVWRWRLHLAHPPTSAPVATAPGRFALTFADGRVELRDETGRAVWAVQPMHSAVRWPVVAGDRLWVAADAGQIIGLRLSDGGVALRIPLTAPLAAPPATAGGWLYLPSRDRVLFALTPPGEPAWGVNLPAAAEAQPVVVDGQLLVAGRDRHLWGYDARTGRRLWGLRLEADLTATPIAAWGRAFVATWDGSVAAVRPH